MPIASPAPFDTLMDMDFAAFIYKGKFNMCDSPIAVVVKTSHLAFRIQVQEARRCNRTSGNTSYDEQKTAVMSQHIQWGEASAVRKQSSTSIAEAALSLSLTTNCTCNA